MSLFISKIFFLAAVSLLLPFLVLGRSCCCQCPSHPCVHILAGGFTYWIVEWGILHYWTMGLWPSDCNFFLLSNYRNIEYCIGEFKKLSDYQISDQGLNLSDYRISDSEKNYRLPPLPTALKTF
jgi:hypothetical protein